MIGGEGPGEAVTGSSSSFLGEPKFPYPVDVPNTPADRREYFIGPELGLVLCYVDDRLVAWALSKNRSPIEDKIACLKVGQTYDEVREIMGPDQSNHPGWNGRFLGRRLMYHEGSSSPLTGSRGVLIDLQREVVVSIKTGKFTIGPRPWEVDYDPKAE